MATIPWGHSAYMHNYPVLWSDWPDPLYMYSDASFSSTKLLQIRRYQLVHYISGYRDSGGYRWFFCRVYRSGSFKNSYWEVGWVPAVRLSDGKQVLKALGRYYITSGGSKRRLFAVRYDAGMLCADGCAGGVDCHDEYMALDLFDWCGYAYDYIDGPYHCGSVWLESPNAHIVPYPGQENETKPWIVCGASNWWLAGGRLHGLKVNPCVSNVIFFETGIMGDDDPNTPYWYRFN